MKDFQTTAELSLPEALIDQVIGQERAVAIARLAASQRRFLLLVGEPGTGKSLIGRAVAALLPTPEDYAVAALANPDDPTRPEIIVRSRQGMGELIQRCSREARDATYSLQFILALGAVASVIVGFWLAMRDRSFGYFLAALIAIAWLWLYRRTRTPDARRSLPKILASTAENQAPFIDATGLSEGALFGDVRHDPYQSGGFESPPHLLVEAGAVHRAHGGVLYIDEIGALSAESQRLLLTAIQEKKLPITGRQGGSSGTLVSTGPVPCDFVLIAACNPEDLSTLTPALRSRFLGYGYEVLTATSMPDSEAIRGALARFVAQEVTKDGRIPHFSRAAVDALIAVARLRAEQSGEVTLRLRELGGLVRTAGDLARGAAVVEAEHVHAALDFAVSIEEQIQLEHKAKTFHPVIERKLSH